MLQRKKFMTNYYRRQRRLRYKLKSVMKNKYRLTIFKSSKNIYVQLIDDCKSNTIVALSSFGKSFIEYAGNIEGVNRSNKKVASIMGKAIADKAKKVGICDNIVFDRGANKYCGVVKSFADAARSNGLNF